MIIYGKELKQELIDDINQRLSKNKNLSFLLYLDKEDTGSYYYSRSLKKLFDSFAIPYTEVNYDRNLSEEENLEIFRSSIKNNSVMLLRPLPCKEEKFVESIPADSDPDMLTSENRGKLYSGNLDYLPATAKSVKRLIEYVEKDISGKKAAVFGRSLSVGLPCFELLQTKGCTVALIHSKTKEEDKKEALMNSDIIVFAIGKKQEFQPTDIKKNATLIDCGFSKTGGDIPFEAKEEYDFSMTPTPGGVGVLTPYYLLINALILKESE